MHVRLEAPSAVDQLVLDRKVTIGISGSLPSETLPDDIEAIGVGWSDLVFVVPRWWRHLCLEVIRAKLQEPSDVGL